MLLRWHAAAPAPPPAGPVCREGEDALTVAGSLDRVFVWCGEDLCLVDRDQAALLAALAEAGVRPPLRAASIAHFLHHGFVDAPHTVRRGVLRLGPGDRLAVRRDGARLVYRTDHAFPWPAAGSRGDSEPSTARLLALLAAAVERSLGAGPALLMLSSGKDSVALALACREAGRDDVRAVTYATGPDDPEARDAAGFARRLGLPHAVVPLPDDPRLVEEAVTAAFARASEPCGDPTLVPFLLGAAGAGLAPGEALVDGLNNDSYVGYMLSARERDGSHRSDRWLAPLRPWRHLFPPWSVASAALRSRAEWHFFGGRWLRHAETRRFFPDSVDTGSEWLRRSRALRHLDDFDFRAAVRGRHADQNAMIVKAHVAAETAGARACFPFTDPDLVDWWYHLPESARFDRRTLTNKVLLRRLLRERLDYDDARIGKRVFEFEGPRFLARHRAWVEHEIGACPLWQPQVRPLVRGLLDRPAAVAKMWPSLLALFQLSGWLRRHDDA